MRRAAWNEPGVVGSRTQLGLERDPTCGNGMACPNTWSDGAGDCLPGGVRHPGTVFHRIGVGGVEAAPRAQFRTSYGESPEEGLLMDWQKLRYAASGLLRRTEQKRLCHKCRWL